MGVLCPVFGFLFFHAADGIGIGFGCAAHRRDGDHFVAVLILDAERKGCLCGAGGDGVGIGGIAPVRAPKAGHAAHQHRVRAIVTGSGREPARYVPGRIQIEPPTVPVVFQADASVPVPVFYQEVFHRPAITFIAGKECEGFRVGKPPASRTGVEHGLAGKTVFLGRISPEFVAAFREPVAGMGKLGHVRNAGGRVFNGILQGVGIERSIGRMPDDDFLAV